MCACLRAFIYMIEEFTNSKQVIPVLYLNCVALKVAPKIVATVCFCFLWMEMRTDIRYPVCWVQNKAPTKSRIRTSSAPVSRFFLKLFDNSKFQKLHCTCTNVKCDITSIMTILLNKLISVRWGNQSMKTRKELCRLQSVKIRITTFLLRERESNLHIGTLFQRFPWIGLNSVFTNLIGSPISILTFLRGLFINFEIEGVRYRVLSIPPIGRGLLRLTWVRC
jgi:hypothetical protein